MIIHNQCSIQEVPLSTGAPKNSRQCRSQSKKLPCLWRQQRWDTKEHIYGGTAHCICSYNSTPQPCLALPNTGCCGNRSDAQGISSIVCSKNMNIWNKPFWRRERRKKHNFVSKNWVINVSPPKISMWCVVSLTMTCHNFGTEMNFGQPIIWAYLSWNVETNSIEHQWQTWV